MPRRLDAAREHATLGREDLADHRPAHPAGAPENADPHPRLPLAPASMPRRTPCQATPGADDGGTTDEAGRRAARDPRPTPIAGLP